MARVPPVDPCRESRHRERPHGPGGTPKRQQRRHQHQRQDSAEHHAVADERAELLEARKIDELQPVERRRRRPHPEEHARRRAAEAVDGRRRLRAGVGPRACIRHTAAPRHPRRGQRASRSMRSPPLTASRRQYRACRAARTSDSAEGIEPTSTSQGERKTRKSSGRMSASDPAVLRMLSRRITDSVSTAIRCPPANCTWSGGRSSSGFAAVSGSEPHGPSRRATRRAASSARGKNRRRTAAAAGFAISRRLRRSDATYPPSVTPRLMPACAPPSCSRSRS